MSPITPLPLPQHVDQLAGRGHAQRVFAGGGRATLEGVGTGDTTIEIYQGTETPKLVTVSVQEVSAVTKPLPAPAPVEAPAAFKSRTAWASTLAISSASGRP